MVFVYKNPAKRRKAYFRILTVCVYLSILYKIDFCYITIGQPLANVSGFRKAKMKCLKGISSRAFAS